MQDSKDMMLWSHFVSMCVRCVRESQEKERKKERERERDVRERERERERERDVREKYEILESRET